MNNPILNLLINVNGALSRKSYLAAVILMLMLLGISWSLAAYDELGMNLVNTGFFDFDQLSYFSLDHLIWFSIPEFIPIRFLVFYSILVITIKRARALMLSKFTTVLLVIINVIFFNALLKISFIFDVIQEFGIYFVLACLLLGLIVNLYFIINKAGDDDDLVTRQSLILCGKSTPKNYDRFTYIFFIGKLMLYNLIIALVIGFVFLVFSDALNDFMRGVLRNGENISTLALLAVLYTFFFSGLYLYATAKRLNNAGYPTYILIVYIISISIISGIFTYFIVIERSYAQTLLGVSTIFFSLVLKAQILPFLLKEKAIKKMTNHIEI
jgi:hypothetical protein